MKYSKPALSFEEQAQLLIERGLVVESKARLTECLERVNYYRLSAYWYPFKRVDAATGREGFAVGTRFEMIWERYVFDRELRLLLMDAIEQVEVAILRTRLVEQFTRLHGPFCYCDAHHFDKAFPAVEFNRLIHEIQEGVGRSKEEFVDRYQRKYAGETFLPLWMAVETMTFGQLLTIFRYLSWKEKKQLARGFDLFPPVLESWLLTLNFIRNACAHHGRLWNRELPVKPKLPEERHHPEWHRPAPVGNGRIFGVLMILRYLLRFIDAESRWPGQVAGLLAKYPNVPRREMGFVKGWEGLLR